MDEVVIIPSNSESSSESTNESNEDSDVELFEGESDFYNLLDSQNSNDVENQIHKCSIVIVVWRVLGLIPFIILGFYFGFKSNHTCEYGYSWFLIVEGILCSLRLISQVIYILTKNYQYFIYEKIIYNILVIGWTISALIYGTVNHGCEPNHTSETFLVFWISIAMSLGYRMMVCIVPALCCCGIHMHEKYKNYQIIRYVENLVPLSFTNGTLVNSDGEVIQNLDLDDDKCIICLQNYKETTDTIIKMKCGHHFHKQCNTEWLKEQPICPYCKTNIIEKD
jgi:hypothetical protein